MQASACDSGAAQRWIVASDGTLRIDGMCLVVLGPADVNGTKAGLARCSGAAAQRWSGQAGAVLVNAASGAGVRFRNAASGLCLTNPLQPGASLATGPAVTVGACTAADPGITWQHR